ncbi:MAG: hypothetical protein IJ578_09485 [Bacteroidales bacterium]|nr:hypothetical protein [Bacteroidales bacterium]
MSADPASSVLDQFFLKLGTLLTMTKDALLEDFLGDMPSYFATATDELDKLKTVDDVRNYLIPDKNHKESALQKFIEHVFERLGYDLSNFEKNQELYDLIASVFSTVDAIGDALEELADEGIDWEDVKVQAAGDGKNAKLSVGELFYVSGGDDHVFSYSKGGFSASLSFGDIGILGKLEPLFKLINNLFKLIGKFRDMEWEALGEEYPAFGDYMADTYLNKEFAERIFDHILVVLLRNAKTVFDEELRELARQKEKVEALIKQVKEEVRAQIAQEIEKIRKELDELEKQLLNAATAARDELLARYNQLRRELDRLMREALGEFGKVGDILDKIYKVLDFLGLIQTQTIEVAKFIPNPGSVPTPSLEEVSKELAKAYQDNVDSAVADVNAAIKSAVAQVKGACPTVEIYVLRWSKIAQMFTDPEAYVKEQFPVDDYDDAAALVSKIYTLVQAFNPDVPDFSSVTAIINELIARLKRELEKAGNEAVKDIRQVIQDFITFLEDVKKALVQVAEDFKKGIQKELKEKGKELERLKNEILSEARSIIDAAEKDGKAVLKELDAVYRSFRKEMNPELAEYLQKILIAPLVKVVQDKAKQHEIFKEVEPEMWQKAFDAEYGKAKSGAAQLTFISEYKKLFGELEKFVSDTFNPDTWEKRFSAMAKALEDEFNNQTKNVPGSQKAWENFGKSQVDNLLAGKSLDNPFSAVDFSAYMTIVADHVKAMVPYEFEGYYTRFKSVTETAMAQLIGAADAAGGEIYKQAGALADGAEAYLEKVKAFADDVITAYWAELKRTVYKEVVRPLLMMIEKKVKSILREILKQIIDAVSKKIKEMVSDEDVRKVVKYSAAAAQLATEITDLVDDGKKVSCWADALHFAVRIYQTIPEPIKDAVKDLVDLPSLEGLLDSVKLPEYQLDMGGKFFAVNVYKYKENFSFDMVAFVGERKFDGEEEAVPGIYVLPVIQAKYKDEFNLGDSHKLTVDAGGSLNKGTSKNDKTVADKTGFFFSKPEGFDFPKVDLLASEKSVAAGLTLQFGRGQKGKEPEILYLYGDPEDPGILTITMKDYPQTVYVGYQGEQGFNVAYLGRLKDLNFIVRLNQANAFFEKILKGDIEFGLDSLTLGYALKEWTLENEKIKKGLTFGGEYHIRIPLKPTIDLEAIKLDNLALVLGSGNGLSFGSFEFGIDLNFTADFSVMSFTLSDLGFGFDFNFMTPDFHFGDWDFSPTFKFPDGIGIAIDIEDIITGAGFVHWDLDKGEFLGGFELMILELVGVSAIFILNTKMPDGSKGFSFMGAITATFNPGFQLGMGFSLTAVGAALGLNRRVDEDALRGAVYDGSLESVMFAQDLKENLSTIMANMATYYPVAEDYFFFGLMAKLTWAEILEISCGLFIQVPDVIIIMAGGIHLKMVDAAEKLISMNADFLASLDVRKGFSFDAALYDTKLVGIELHGSIALRIYWGGDTKGFLFSAGGFHPSYTPEPGFNVPDMQRIGFKLREGCVEISLDAYLAITSNTFQFGANASLMIGWDIFHVSGYLFFNTLFQFSPFRFMFDVGIGVAVKCVDWTLLAVDLYLEVSGPAKWHAAGKARFTFIITYEMSVSETWGKSQSDSDKKYINLLPLLDEALADQNNWTVIRNDVVDGLVSTYVPEDGSFVMSPSDTVTFCEQIFPLDEVIDKYGEYYPQDANKVVFENVWVAGQPMTKPTDLNTSFARAQFKSMSDYDKLIAPSYEDMKGGFAMQAGHELKYGAECVKDIAATSVKVQNMGDDDWARWQVEADRQSAPTTAKAAPKTVAKTPMKIAMKGLTPTRMYRVGRGNQASLRKDLQKDIVMRPSLRREKPGFQRYIKDLDAMMANSVREYIDKLEK